MIFTSIPAKPNVTPSDLFKEMGNPGDVPTSISDVRINAVTDTASLEYNMFEQYFATHVASALHKKNFVVNAQRYTPIDKVETELLFSTPPVAVTFGERNMNPDLVDALANLGFHKDSTAGRSYFRGSGLNLQKFAALARMNPDMDSYTPYGIASLRGGLIFFMLNRMIVGSLMAFRRPSLFKGKQFKEYGGMFTGGSQVDSNGNAFEEDISYAVTYLDKKVNYRIMTDNISVTVKNDGVFFPYFHGLLLPDKNYVPAIVSRRFATLLGTSAEGSLSIQSSIQQGFKSLSTTEGGMELTHAFYVLDLALRSGAKPLIVHRSDNSYVGMVLSGKGSLFWKNGLTIKPTVHDQLQQQVGSFDKHAQSLETIVQIISELQIAEKSRDATFPVIDYTPQYFSSPRRIHDAFRRFTIDSDTRKALKKALLLLSFRQTFYDAKSVEKIAWVIETLGKKIFPEPDVPILYRSDVMFTSNVGQSILSAFGSRAPVLSTTGGRNIPIPVVTRKRNLYTVMADQKIQANSLPVYIRPVQEASRAWGDIMKNHAINIKVNAGGKFIGADKTIPQKKDGDVSTLLSRFFAYDEKPLPTAAKKRKEKDISGGDEDLRSGKSAKRVKTNVGELNNLFSSLGVELPVINTDPVEDGGIGSDQDEDMDD